MKNQKIVLCIDTGLVPLLSWASLLNHDNYLIIAAESAREGLDAFDREQIALVVLALPIGELQETIHAIKARRADVPIVVYLHAASDGLSLVDAFVHHPTKLLETVQGIL